MSEWKKFWSHPIAKYVFITIVLIFVLVSIFRPDFEYLRNHWIVKVIAAIFIGFFLFIFIRWINYKSK